MSRRQAFTLTEVVIALGIVAFVIVGLLGLVSVSLERTKESKRDTLWRNMAQEVITKLRTRPWSQLTNAPLGPYYFDAEGNLEPGPSDKTLYECSIISFDAASVTNAPGQSPDISSYLKGYSLKIAWPYGASKQDELKLPVSIAKYE